MCCHNVHFSKLPIMHTYGCWSIKKYTKCDQVLNKSKYHTNVEGRALQLVERLIFLIFAGEVYLLGPTIFPTNCYKLYRVTLLFVLQQNHI